MAREIPPRALSVAVHTAACEATAAAFDKSAKPHLLGWFVEAVRSFIERDRHRRELLTILAEDHRTPVDLAVDPNELRDWASKSPWRI